VGKEVFGKEHIRITNVCVSTYDTTPTNNKFQIFYENVTKLSQTGELAKNWEKYGEMWNSEAKRTVELSDK